MQPRPRRRWSAAASASSARASSALLGERARVEPQVEGGTVQAEDVEPPAKVGEPTVGDPLAAVAAEARARRARAPRGARPRPRRRRLRDAPRSQSAACGTARPGLPPPGGRRRPRAGSASTSVVDMPHDAASALTSRCRSSRTRRRATLDRLAHGGRADVRVPVPVAADPACRTGAASPATAPARRPAARRRRPRGCPRGTRAPDGSRRRRGAGSSGPRPSARGSSPPRRADRRPRLAPSASSAGRRAARAALRRRRCFSRIVRGSASVGWAVRTSSTDTRRAASTSSSSPTPAPASRASASSSDSRNVPPSRSISRLRLTRWCCSAMFARWKYIVNARRITACVETGSAAIVVASAREAAASPSRPRRARPRICSSSRYVSSPSCSTSTRPSVSPSRRTSDLSDRSSDCSVGPLIAPLRRVRYAAAP